MQNYEYDDDYDDDDDDDAMSAAYSPQEASILFLIENPYGQSILKLCGIFFPHSLLMKTRTNVCADMQVRV
jgi:hypothetical protein